MDLRCGSFALVLIALLFVVVDMFIVQDIAQPVAKYEGENYACGSRVGRFQNIPYDMGGPKQQH